MLSSPRIIKVAMITTTAEVSEPNTSVTVRARASARLAATTAPSRSDRSSSRVPSSAANRARSAARVTRRRAVRLASHANTTISRILSGVRVTQSTTSAAVAELVRSSARSHHQLGEVPQVCMASPLLRSPGADDQRRLSDLRLADGSVAEAMVPKPRWYPPAWGDQVATITDDRSAQARPRVRTCHGPAQPRRSRWPSGSQPCR